MWCYQHLWKGCLRNPPKNKTKLQHASLLVQPYRDPITQTKCFLTTRKMSQVITDHLNAPPRITDKCYWQYITFTFALIFTSSAWFYILPASCMSSILFLNGKCKTRKMLLTVCDMIYLILISIIICVFPHLSVSQKYIQWLFTQNWLNSSTIYHWLKLICWYKVWQKEKSTAL